ncbi:DUF4380 domain-containing protein [Microbulbifer thermotolerans]|nr:DUF4380 domain-containing protein [Microbulbifer thermotolerans]MCX2842355.1 DUF4380 domain-containing protein [Microbulbifer thermotolerans]
MKRSIKHDRLNLPWRRNCAGIIRTRGLTALLAALLVGQAYGHSDAQPEIYKLQNSKLSYSFTPQIGGRGLAFSAAGEKNLLKVGTAVQEQPNPDISPQAGFIPYQGHIIWPGPQADWWKQQEVNPQRRAAGAVWPPDPFTVLNDYELTAVSDKSATIVSPVSPVTGLQLTKEFTLKDDVLLHRVTAVNRRETPVKWDIWFNTRVSPETRVYVPIADFSRDLRLEKFPEMTTEVKADAEKQRLGLFGFARGENIKAKAFIEPSAGWIAAFTQGQLFVIEFPRQARDSIHPDQGQVELYLEQDPQNPDAGVLELEVHAPYRELAPGESMSATETWRALTYTGKNSVEAHLRALRELGLQGVSSPQ